MSWNMPDGASSDQYDHYMGYDQPDEDEPQPAVELIEEAEDLDGFEEEFAAYEWAVEHGVYHGPAPKGY